MSNDTESAQRLLGTFYAGETAHQAISGIIRFFSLGTRSPGHHYKPTVLMAADSGTSSAPQSFIR